MITRELNKVDWINGSLGKESSGKGKRKRLIVSCIRVWTLRTGKRTCINWDRAEKDVKPFRTIKDRNGNILSVEKMEGVF